LNGTSDSGGMMKVIRELSFLPKVSPVLKKRPIDESENVFGELQQKKENLHSDREVSVTPKPSTRSAHSDSDSKMEEDKNRKQERNPDSRPALKSELSDVPTNQVLSNNNSILQYRGLKRYQIQGKGNAIHSFTKNQEENKSSLIDIRK
jgi:hypothetical protein